MNAFRIHGRKGAFDIAYSVNAMTTQTIGRSRVFRFDQQLAVGAFPEFRELIRRQRGIEAIHQRWVGMAARAERHDPRAIFVAGSSRPLLDVGMLKFVTGGITAMTPGT